MKDEMMTREFWRAAGMRSLRTFAQGVLTLAGAGAANLFSIAWSDILVTSLGLAVMSLLTALVTGIPEVPPATAERDAAPPEGGPPTPVEP